VLLADGSYKAIGNVTVGDEVVASEPQTGALRTEKVEELHRNEDTDLTEVTVTFERDGVEDATVVKTTWHHPFWNDDTDTWMYAQDLQSGDHLRSADGAVITVAVVRNYVGSAVMRDLTVANLHTYFVIAGDSPVLVHNIDNFTPHPPCSVDQLQDFANQIRTGASHPAAVNSRVVAAGQDSGGYVTAGSSNGWDSGSRAVADGLNIRLVTSRGPSHAEEDLLADNDNSLWPLERVASDNQPPCGIDRHDCAGQLDSRGIQHN
jgi:hypothetical protein